jgi:ferredoxin
MEAVEMRVKIEENLCCGCGMCVSFSPELFGQSPSGKAVTKVFCVPFSLEDECSLAVQFCPRSAIKVVNLKQFE